MLRALTLSALVACAAGYQAGAPRPATASAMSVARPARVAVPLTQRSARAIVMAEDPTDAEISNAAAITGAFIGIYVLDNLLTAGILAGLAAYATTTDSKVGDFVKSSGATVAKSYKKTLSFIEEKQVLSKAKEVTDKVVGTVTKINDNYGISEKIDSKLKISDKVSTAADKIGEVTSSVTSKVDELSSSMK